MTGLECSVVLAPLTPADGGGFLAAVPDLPGRMSDGATLEEALASVCDAIAAWIEEAQALGSFVAPAANESGMTVEAAVYALAIEGTIAPTAEIAECRWVEPAAPGVLLAPLSAILLRR